MREILVLSKQADGQKIYKIFSGRSKYALDRNWYERRSLIGKCCVGNTLYQWGFFLSGVCWRPGRKVLILEFYVYRFLLNIEARSVVILLQVENMALPALYSGIHVVRLARLILKNFLANIVGFWLFIKDGGGGSGVHNSCVQYFFQHSFMVMPNVTCNENGERLPWRYLG